MRMRKGSILQYWEKAQDTVRAARKVAEPRDSTTCYLLPGNLFCRTACAFIAEVPGFDPPWQPCLFMRSRRTSWWDDLAAQFMLLHVAEQIKLQDSCSWSWNSHYGKMLNLRRERDRTGSPSGFTNSLTSSDVTVMIIGQIDGLDVLAHLSKTEPESSPQFSRL
ncbi:uncharacterized protein LOC114020843 [Chelonia mydas]|uniref:uncharacterized protein LOC114020843 n=1 Tax=Chelonia mydas TaxID=8469 RepID=UPI0018A22934|nr:uncharacterized protein LOC114020843 [Chelonia mydas]XP_043380164.1 uncharacterized protein LOC114020843 [Chelonia mydas]